MRDSLPHRLHSQIPGKTPHPERSNVYNGGMTPPESTDRAVLENQHTDEHEKKCGSSTVEYRRSAPKETA